MTDRADSSEDNTENNRHDWQLWVPMDDGTDRERRKCRHCGMIQTQEARFT